MELTIAPSATYKLPTLRQVFRRISLSVAGFCKKKMVSACKTVGVTLRLERAALRIEHLLARFRKGEILWRKRPARPAADGRKPRASKPGLGLPSDPGWLAEALPLTAIYHGGDLTLLMQQDEMQALMGATPQVRRIMLPIFKMMALDNDVLKVPEGYGEAASEVAADADAPCEAQTESEIAACGTEHRPIEDDDEGRRADWVKLAAE
jgi:hypothetical protein